MATKERQPRYCGVNRIPLPSRWPAPGRLDSGQYIYKTGYMDTESVLAALGALSQSTRLEIFRLLVRHEPDGLPAGDVARRLELPQNTISVHLATLKRAGLLTSQRHSRLIIYRACLSRLQDLMSFLVKDCCAGSPELCASVITNLSACCPGKETQS